MRVLIGPSIDGVQLHSEDSERIIHVRTIDLVCTQRLGLERIPNDLRFM